MQSGWDCQSGRVFFSWRKNHIPISFLTYLNVVHTSGQNDGETFSYSNLKVINNVFYSFIYLFIYLMNYLVYYLFTYFINSSDIRL